MGTQHDYTTAQGTYTANVMAQLDPKRELFKGTIMHRDISPTSVKKGKDLSLITDRLDRAILFDDRIKNFAPQNGENGIQVKLFDDDGVRGNHIDEIMEIARLVGISILALLAPDVRDVVRYFRSQEHIERFPKKDMPASDESLSISVSKSR